MPLLTHSHHLIRDAKRYPAGTPPYADIIGSVSVSSAVVGLNWAHSITLEFRSESPLDHIEFSLAGQSFIGSQTISYCGCSVVVSVVESTASYNMAELETPGKSSAKSPKCKGAYTVPRAGKKASMSVAAPLAVTQASTTSSVVIATVVVAVAIVAVGLLVVQRRIRRAVTADNNEEVKPPTVANPVFEVDNDEEVKPATDASSV
jgi:hypothetical protein